MLEFLLAVETMPFSEIQKLSENVAVFFYDSQFPTALLDEYKGLESEFGPKAASGTTPLRFFVADKRDSANADIFELPDFQHLPTLHVLILQDRQSEGTGPDLTLAKMEFFLGVKTAQIKEEIIERIGSMADYVNAKNRGEYVIFVENECRTCNRVFSILARYAAIKGEKLNIAFCDDIFETCDSLKVFEFPTVLKGAKEFSIEQVMDLFQPQGEEFEGQKPTGLKKYAQHSLRKRIDALEAKIRLLEEKLAVKKDEL